MSYESDSPVDRLAAVRAAISRCLTSQEYSIASRRVRNAELSALRAMEKDLMEECQMAADSSVSMSELGVQMRPSE